MKNEYRVISFKVKGCFGRKLDSAHVEGELNAHGAEGWKLIHISALAGDLGKTVTLVATMERLIN